jgi:hypothetical protein
MEVLSSLIRQSKRGRIVGLRLWLVVAFIASLVFTVTSVTPVGADTLSVTNVNDSGPGSLRQAVTDANNSVGGDVITFALGSGPHTITLTTGELLITSNININGPLNDPLTISGSSTSRVFRIDGGTVNIDHLTITQGKPSVAPADNTGRGGGLFVSGGTVTLTSVTIANNNASYGPVSGDGGLGGGAYIVGGAVTFINCTVSGNTALGNVRGGRAGGVYVDGGTVSLVNTPITGNTAAGGSDNSGGFGGGMYVANGTATLTSSTIGFNQALGLGIGSGSGGGAYIGGGTLNLVSSTISNNLASDDPAPGAALGTVGASGGGVYLSGGTLALTESTISGNTAEGGQFGAQGGGIANTGGTVTLNRSTINGNTASGGRSAQFSKGALGGGLYIASGTTTVSASMIGNNNSTGAEIGSGFGGGFYIASGATATVDNSTIYQNAAKAGTQTNGVGGGFYIASGADEHNPSVILHGKATLHNDTISQNAAAGANGGIGQGSNFYFDEYGEAAFTNTIVAGVSAASSCAIVANTITNAVDNGANLDQDGSCSFFGPGSLRNVDPKLQEVPAGTDSPTLYLMPQAGSPVIDAGNNATCTKTDQRGFVRPQNGKCEIGSIEIAAISFGDVPANDPAYEAITQLAARGIINGCDSTAVPPLFCPHDSTLREQMAALIVRAIPGWLDETWPNNFTDQTNDTELMQRVGTLQHYGVVTGYNDCPAQGKTAPCYGPLDPVLRAQAISFITRAFVAKGYWTQQPTDPNLYGGALLGTGHEQDASTYWFYTRSHGGVPDYPEGGSFPVSQSAPRDWFARLLWTALLSRP